MKFRTRSTRWRVHRAIARALTIAPTGVKLALAEALLAKSALKAKCHKNRLARLVSKLKRRAR
ncbi:hypothetical protein TETLON2b_000162 [Candidatus Hodgkinia cicadicola]|nr:hypothetical protein TETLON2a_000165 [Candidatus Hodgkinia cicadicola]AUG91647.1 hypothetical protein TETLON2b_000162 [Candidatus Hodgkinia cicadicola]